MIDPTDLVMVAQVIKAARDERGKREGFWKTFRNEFIGTRWRQGLGVKRISNHVYIFATTMLPMLFYRTPRATLHSKYGEAGLIIADVFSQALNDTIKHRKLAKTVRDGIFNSFYAFGLFKTGLIPDEGYEDNLTPFAVSISPFRAIWDDTAKSFDMCQFVGHEFQMGMEEFLNNPRYDLSSVPVDQLYTTDKGNVDDAAEDKTAGEDREDMVKEMPPRVHLIEVEWREAKKIATYAQIGTDQFALVRLDDPYRTSSCYHLLGYIFPSNTVMPVAPAQGWWEQWRELEEQERDLMHQIKNEKTVVAFPSGAGDSAKILKEAKEHSFVTNVNAMGTAVTYGGATDQKLLAVTDSRQRFEFASGMSDTMQGAPSRTNQTATAVTKQLQYANIKIEDQQFAISEIIAEIVDDWKHYMWNDPNVLTQFTYNDATTQQSHDLQMRGNPTNSGGIMDSDFLVEVPIDSFTRDSGPMDRANAQNDLGLLLGPILQAGAMQGFMLDLPRVLREYGPKLGSDKMASFLIPMTPIAQQIYMAGAQKEMQPQQVLSVEQLDALPRTMEGGGQSDGGLMSSVMSGSPTLQETGMQAAPIGLAQRTQ